MSDSSKINVLFVADIVGKPGRDITARMLPGLLRKYDVDFCIANGENAADGKGITPREFFELRQMGIDVIPAATISGIKKKGISFWVSRASSCGR